MNKTRAIDEVVRATASEPVIFTTGYSSRIAASIRDRPSHFYMTGSMGLAADIGIGVALSSDQHVVVVDGDGSLLMNPGCLLTAGAMRDLRLVHVVLDDGRYASTGGQEVPRGRVDFGELAAVAGYAVARSVTDPADLRAALTDGLTRAAPTFIHCSLEAADEKPPQRIDIALDEMFARFTFHLSRLPQRLPEQFESARTLRRDS